MLDQDVDDPLVADRDSVVKRRAAVRVDGVDRRAAAEHALDALDVFRHDGDDEPLCRHLEVAKLSTEA